MGWISQIRAIAVGNRTISLVAAGVCEWIAERFCRLLPGTDKWKTVHRTFAVRPRNCSWSLCCAVPPLSEQCQLVRPGITSLLCQLVHHLGEGQLLHDIHISDEYRFARIKGWSTRHWRCRFFIVQISNLALDLSSEGSEFRGVQLHTRSIRFEINNLRRRQIHCASKRSRDQTSLKRVCDMIEPSTRRLHKIL